MKKLLNNFSKNYVLPHVPLLVLYESAPNEIVLPSLSHELPSVDKREREPALNKHSLI